ncbi:MAG: hypothetical protein A3E31_07995 [Candidatus Rokubacteria bacterium RIFCSPHIGHO2_12_FULL_73_22]|nr:MAG: hypothetical protein A3D33_11940 [Candidatus Rokubacteria bacterium RIFCSPHIGHO2_02_FULL_73_26]OGL01730.1 MAG: hypothetical protein A3E31_07995 [Candidatus Rokubacteria bacterium RIFCSPHIGHO2_12_FULL_73_22]
MTQSLTDWLQQARVTVVEVDREAGRLRVRGTGDACSDLACSEATVVVTDDAARAGLDALYPGDIVRVESAGGRPERIVVLRRVWDELTSPEF